VTRPDRSHGARAIAAALLLGAYLLGRPARATTEVPAGTYDTVTWTTAGNPYKILGNLTITQLTVEAGTEVLVQVPGVGASYSISVTTLVVNGTPANPVVFQGDVAGTAQSAWRGLWVAGSASVTGAIVRNASDGIRLSAAVTPPPSSTISRTRFEYDSYAVIIEGGDVTIDAITAVNLNHGIWNDQGKTVRLTNSLFRDTFNPIISRVGSFTITNCTILHAPTTAVDFSPASTTATLQILNTIIANGQTGVHATPNAQLTIAYSDIFGNAVNLDGAELGAGNISKDPAAYQVTDYHLSAGSPCIDTGSASGAPDHDLDFVARPKGAGVDMGAYEYDPAGGRGGAGGAAGGGAGGGGGGGGGGAAGASGTGGGGAGTAGGAGAGGGGAGGAAGAGGGGAGAGAAGGAGAGGGGGSGGAGGGGVAGRGGASGTGGAAAGASGTSGGLGGGTGGAGAGGVSGSVGGAAGAVGAAGTAGGGGAAGGGTGGRGGADGSGSGGHPTTPAGNDGCGCATAGTAGDALAGVLWLLALLPIARPPRRRAR